jgi:tripartite-type tricarboxylate transporter receptor subunit TctC
MLMQRAAVALALAFAAVTAPAQNYPSHPVKVVVPYAVGGSADVYGRVLAAKLSETMGQPFVIENRPGGGAVIGTDAVAKSAPDGYTVLIMSNTHTVNETLIPKKPYDLMRDLAPVTGINSQDLLLVGAPTLKVNNLRELIALAKKQPG